MNDIEKWDGIANKKEMGFFMLDRHVLTNWQTKSTHSIRNMCNSSIKMYVFFLIIVNKQDACSISEEAIGLRVSNFFSCSVDGEAERFVVRGSVNEEPWYAFTHKCWCYGDWEDYEAISVTEWGQWEDHRGGWNRSLDLSFASLWSLSFLCYLAWGEVCSGNTEGIVCLSLLDSCCIFSSEVYTK